jgi:hypothetical protein
MRMTSTETGSSGNALSYRRLALAAVVSLLAGTLVAGCGGGGDKDAEHAAKMARRAKAETADTAVQDGSAATPPASSADKQSRLAEAVVDSKTTAPVDLKYDLLSKPDVGVPFEIELTFAPRLPADAIEVELTEAPGLTIVGDKTAKFTPVEAGQTYTSKVLVQGDKSGLYYVSVLARMSTQVQTETRAFAVPVVIGNPPAAQKPSRTQDASGQAIQPMRADEPK